MSNVTQTDAQLIFAGKRHNSPSVDREARETSARWTRDVDVLAAYGHGKKQLATFNAEIEAHAVLMATRPQAVAVKRTTVRGADAALARGWRWVDQAVSLVTPLARRDAALADQLAAARPDSDAGLAAGIAALVPVLEAAKASLDEDSGVAARIAEAGALKAGLEVLPGAVTTAKSATVADTVEIDLADGKLCLTMVDLNKAARRAIRNGDLDANTSEYRFHHLNRSGRPATPTDAPPA